MHKCINIKPGYRFWAAGYVRLEFRSRIRGGKREV